MDAFKNLTNALNAIIDKVNELVRHTKEIDERVTQLESHFRKNKRKHERSDCLDDLTENEQ